MITNKEINNQQDCQLNFFKRVLKKLIAPWAWNFDEERIPLDKIPDISLLIRVGRNGHWILNGVDTGILAEGRRGKSAYEVAVELGFDGTESEWIPSLKGEQGERGLQGINGILGILGIQGETGLRGPKGDTPTIIGDMWYISGINTGVRALGNGILSITEYYLASSSNSGVTRTGTNGWTITMLLLTVTNRYLWSYKDILYTDGTHNYTREIIIGVYGNTGNDAVLNAQQLQLLNSVSSDLDNVEAKIGKLATYDSSNNITGLTLYMATKIEDTIAGLATNVTSEGDGGGILQTLFAKIDGPNSPMASLILEVNKAGASISGITQLGLFIGSISTKADAHGVETALEAVADSDGNVTVASIVAKINASNDTSITATANNFMIVDSHGTPTFRINDGNIVAYGNATFTGNIVANSLTLGSGATFALGTVPASGATSSNSTGFQLDLNGLLTASNANIYGTIYATSGTIGGWKIKNNILKSEVVEDEDEEEEGDETSSSITLNSSNASIILDYSGGWNMRSRELVINSHGITTEATSRNGWFESNKINTDGSGFLASGNISWNTQGEGTLAGWSFDSTKLSSESSETEGNQTFTYKLELDSSVPGIQITKSLNNFDYVIKLDGTGIRAQQLVNNSVTYNSFNLGITGGGYIANGGILWSDGGSNLTFTVSPTFEEKIIISTDNDGEGISFNLGFICASGLYNGDTHDENMHFGSFSGEFYFHNTDSSGSTGSTTTLYASNFSQTSDIRLKENILDFFISAETLAQMPSVLFNFKSNKDIRQAGTIAQDWLKILPEVVRENRDGTLSMNYANASMVSVISMAKEIVKLKEEIKELKANL